MFSLHLEDEVSIYEIQDYSIVNDDVLQILTNNPDDFKYNGPDKLINIYFTDTNGIIIERDKLYKKPIAKGDPNEDGFVWVSFHIDPYSYEPVIPEVSLESSAMPSISMEQDITDLQLAIAELYELLGG